MLPIPIALSLLAEVSRIRQRHVLAADLTGESFNVFDITGARTWELSHTRIFRELLDPAGSHGMGPAFLKAFLNVLFGSVLPHPRVEKLRSLLQLDALHRAVVETEYCFGPVTEQKGGKIDIRISIGGCPRILIENKIHAVEQDRQIQRYLNSDPDALLCYLTLDGKKASTYQDEGSAKPLEYLRLSYKDHILEWIDACARIAFARPGVRETLIQYGHLVKSLTNQNRSTIMSDEIASIVLSSYANFEAFTALDQSRLAIEKTIYQAVGDRINQVALDSGFIASSFSHDCIDFRTPQMNSRGLVARFQIENGRWFYGLKREGKPLPDDDVQRLKNAWRVTFENKEPRSTEWWPVWDWWVDRKPELLARAYFDIINGNDVSASPSFVNDVARLSSSLRQVASSAFEP